jgi:hypothetical protein
MSDARAPEPPPLVARVCDPAGPRWWRVLVTTGIAPLALLGGAMPWSTSWRAASVLTAVAWLVLVRLVVPRLRTRRCELVLEPGAVRLRRAGAASQRIHAEDIRAASTARLASGFSLALTRYGEGDRPLWLELERSEDVDAVRRALGIGHAGFGEVSWPPRRGVFHGNRTLLDLIAAVLWLGALWAIASGWTEAAITLAATFVVTTIGAVTLGLATRPARFGLTLSPRGLGVIEEGRLFERRWQDVFTADGQGDDIALRTATGVQHVSLRGALPEEREHIAAQIRSAALRARGEGPLPPGIPTSLSVLVPRGEDPRAWIERVDATAASLQQRDGYRVAGVEERELWETLESTDAPPALRAASARILARVAPEHAGPRIALVLSQEHDPAARDRILGALEEDVELAAQALERLDAK